MRDADPGERVAAPVRVTGPLIPRAIRADPTREADGGLATIPLRFSTCRAGRSIRVEIGRPSADYHVTVTVWDAAADGGAVLVWNTTAVGGSSDATRTFESTSGSVTGVVRYTTAATLDADVSGLTVRGPSGRELSVGVVSIDPRERTTLSTPVDATGDATTTTHSRATSPDAPSTDPRPAPGFGTAGALLAVLVVLAGLRR